MSLLFGAVDVNIFSVCFFDGNLTLSMGVSEVRACCFVIIGCDI